MSDQAEQLRLQIKQAQAMKEAKTIAVISGKGGVGKSNFSLNFSISLSKKGYRVLLFDMDIGMGNIDILIGNSSSSSIVDFFQKGSSLKDIRTKGPENISFISGGTGLTSLFKMNNVEFERFMTEFANLQLEYDFIIFDLGAGISQESSTFIMCVDEVITITTPEPTSIMDAYSVIKYLYTQKSDLPVYLICNRAQRDQQGKSTINKLKNTLSRFVGKEITPLGYLPDSKWVSEAVIRQIPFIVLNPNADISKSLNKLVEHYLLISNREAVVQIQQSFLGRLKSFFVGR